MNTVLLMRFSTARFTSECWRCHGHKIIERQSDYAVEPSHCGHCQALQALPVQGIDYFQVFIKKRQLPPCGFPYQRTLEERPLKQRFYYLQNLYHPDHLENKAMAEEMSTWISRGFRTISDPFSRLCYILEHSYHVEGIPQDHQQEAKMDPGFLAEILEWHERLDESSKDPEQKKKLLDLVHAEKESRINDLYKELGDLVQKQGADGAYLDRIIYGIRALQFYGTIQERLQALSV